MTLPRIIPIILLYIVILMTPLATAHATSAQASSDQVVKDTWITGLKSMAAQLTATTLQNAGSFGGMFDSMATNTAILSAQKLQAGAYQNYTPGENLCRFGTLSRSLASADLAATRQINAIDTVLLNRETNNNSYGSPSSDHDQMGKLKNLTNLYCNPGDNNANPVACECDLTQGTCSGPLAARSNRDLDFARLFASRLTLNFNLSDGVITPDEQDVLGFLTTVSAFPILPPLAPRSSELTSSPAVMTAFQDTRKIAAQRGLTRATLAHFVGSRSNGGGGAASAPYMQALLQELGMNAATAQEYLTSEGQNLTGTGATEQSKSASYNAQMEILTKKIYQNPNFYTYLMDKPANIDRAHAAQMAIRLMQRRDMADIITRREMLLSQLLEAKISSEEQRMRARISQAKSTNN